MYRGQLNVNDKCKIDSTGKLMAEDAVISGEIRATSGKIAIFEIEKEKMSYHNFDDGNSSMMEIGNEGIVVDMIPNGNNKHVLTGRLFHSSNK